MGCAPLRECFWPLSWTTVFSYWEYRKGLWRERICHLIYTKLHNFSDGNVSHIPISCVTRENVIGSKVSGICCSKNGIVYLSDSGSNRIYRVDSSTGSCASFGGHILGQLFVLKIHNFYNWNSVEPIDVAIWGDYLMVLDEQCLAIFTPMGILIKKCSIALKCKPASLNIIGKMLVLTRYYVFHLLNL